MGNSKVLDGINKLIAKSHCSMNTLNISFPYEYVANVVDLNWNDVLFAINQGYLSHLSAIEHAQLSLERDDYSQTVLDLACISSEEAAFPHSIHPHIDEMAEMVDEEEKGKTKDKIMFVLLKWVYEQGAGLDDPFYDDILNVAESIWHDFEFAESIIRFASWRNLPTSMIEPNLGSLEKNKAKVCSHYGNDTIFVAIFCQSRKF